MTSAQRLDDTGFSNIVKVNGVHRRCDYAGLVVTLWP